MKKLLLFAVLTFTSKHATAQCNATITPLGYTDICQGSSLNLKASPGTTHQWYLNGSAISGATNDTLNVTIAGSYEVVIDSVGCVDTSAAQIVTVSTSVPSQPGPITGLDTVCVGSIQTYSIAAVSGATGYAWSGIRSVGSTATYLDTTNLPTITGPVFYYQLAPVNYINVYALNGCGSSLSNVKQVVSVGPPQIGGSWTIGDLDVADMMQRVCPGDSHTLFPVMHGFLGAAYTDSYTFQWCLNNVAIPGATDREFVIIHGGNYSVKIMTDHCLTTNVVQKKVYQDMPNSITISPSGPLSYCIGNATPLTVSFDMTGVSDTIKWHWIKGSFYNRGNFKANSIIPDTSGYYTVYAWQGLYPGSFYATCEMYSNAVFVTVPHPLEITQVVDTLFATPGYNSYQWYESGVPLTGATGQSHVLTFDGIYSVEAVFSNGCIETSDTFASNFLPQPPDTSSNSNTNNNNNQTAKISVHPNPAVGPFTVTALVDVSDKTAGITITDLTGKVLFETDAEVKDGVVEQKVDLRDNSARFCIVKVRSKHTNRTAPFYIKN